MSAKTYCKSCDLDMSEYEHKNGLLIDPGGHAMTDHHPGHCPSCGKKLIELPEEAE